MNKELKLYGRSGESTEDFAARCELVADDRADADVAKLRDKYEAKFGALRSKIAAATDAAEVASDQQEARQRDDLLSSAGSLLGGLFGGASRGGLMGSLGRAAGRSGKTSAAATRVDAAKNKVGPAASTRWTTWRPSWPRSSPRSTPAGRPSPPR